MKRVTASEARRNWFRILDEVAAGAVVCIERAGRRILLQREPEPGGGESVPDYASLIRAPSVAQADDWGWRWSGEGDVEPSDAAEEAR